MRKIWLSASLFSVSVLGAFAQSSPTDSASFLSRKLSVAEVNFVSSYYAQDGNNSAVTGGIGTEALTDLSGIFDITLTRTDLRQRQHSFQIGMGVDHYTSASSDKIDPSTVSSASASDNRLYPTFNWSVNNPLKHYTVGAGVSVSSEYDYLSKGANLHYTRYSPDHNREFGLTLSAYLDTWTVIYPVELRELQTTSGPISNPDAHGRKPRNSYNASFSLAQVVNKRLQVALLFDPTYQNGQLGTLYQRVYFTNGSERVEQLPGSRLKLPVGIRVSYFATDRLILRSLYRFYTDDWGITAHSIEAEIPYKITPFISVSPFYRFYAQTAADYFASYQAHSASEEFYTSDFDLSAFTSQMGGLNLRFSAADGLFGIRKLNTLDLRYSHYRRTNGLASNSITLAFKIK